MKKNRSQLYKEQRIVTVLKTFFQMLALVALLYGFLLSGPNRLETKILVLHLTVATAVSLVAIYAAELCKRHLRVIRLRIVRSNRYARTNSMFNMSFTDLCNCFYEATGGHPQPIRTGRIIGELKWFTGSRNDVFRTWLVENGIPYITTFDGGVWFSENGRDWQSAKLELIADNVLRIHELTTATNNF